MTAIAQRLKIAVLNRTFSTTGGGAESYSIALVEQLAAAHEIHVYAQEIAHDWPGVTYHKVSMPLRRPRWINQLWYATATWWATRAGYDVVHSHENTWHGQVQTVHVLPVKYSLFQSRSGLRRALRWFKVITSPRLLTYLGLERARYAPAPGRQVVVTSNSLRATMEDTYPDCRGIVSVVTPGIRLPGPTTSERRREARAALGLPADVPCLLFVANDYRKKGLGALLEALATQPDDVVLAVIGNPAQIPAFREQAVQLGLAGRVFFLGSLADVGPAYVAADLLVHPTWADTFAMVVLEAMAHGLPVVVSGPAYCGISGLLEEGVNALLLDDPRDVTALGEKLTRLITDASLRARLASAAAAFAAGYEWDEIARQQEVLYLKAATTV
jgi:glycosyltransferase involved in cell wall biosynthesis